MQGAHGSLVMYNAHSIMQSGTGLSFKLNPEPPCHTMYREATPIRIRPALEKVDPLFRLL